MTSANKINAVEFFLRSFPIVDVLKIKSLLTSEDDLVSVDNRFLESYILSIDKKVLQPEHVELLKLFLKHGAKPTGDRGQYCLQHASNAGMLPIVKVLVEEGGAEINFLRSVSIREAAEKAHLNVVKYLIKKGANLYAVENDTCLQVTVDNFFEDRTPAQRKNRLKQLDFLINHQNKELDLKGFFDLVVKPIGAANSQERSEVANYLLKYLVVKILQNKKPLVDTLQLLRERLNHYYPTAEHEHQQLIQPFINHYIHQELKAEAHHHKVETNNPTPKNTPKTKRL